MEHKKNKYFDFSILIPAFFIVDVLNKYFPDLNISLICKSVLFLIIVLRIFKGKMSLSKYLLITLFLIFAINQLYITSVFKVGKKLIIDNLRLFVLYVFPILFFIELPSLLSEKKCFNKTYKYYDILIYVVAITIFIGFIFDLAIFKTYKGDRFGYMGVLSKSVSASFFIIFSLLYSYKNNLFLFITILLASLLVGTKSIYLFLILLLLYDFLREKRYLLVSLITITLLVFHDFLLSVTKPLWSLHYSLYKKTDLLTSLTSFRNNIYRELIYNYLDNWSSFNYFFGGRIFLDKFFELSLMDLLSFFGIIGSLIYLYLYVKEATFNGNNIFLYFSILSSLFISTLVGQYFLNSSTFMFSALVFYYISIDNSNESLKRFVR